MNRSPSPAWAPRYGYSNALVNDLCAVADARARVELLPLPADESLRLRFAAYQRSTRSIIANMANNCRLRICASEP